MLYPEMGLQQQHGVRGPWFISGIGHRTSGMAVIPVYNDNVLPVFRRKGLYVYALSIFSELCIVRAVSTISMTPL